MLTRLLVKNFKRIDEAEIALGKNVVLIGPNNSGKTTALQALALWEIGIRRWNERRAGKPSPETKPGIAINRRDLISIPVPSSNLLWRNLHVRGSDRPNDTKNIRIDLTVDGVTDGKGWTCGLEFDYANEESFYCRPLRLSSEKQPDRMFVPDEAGKVKLAFLPPMSGLAAIEPKWEPGRINVLLGEGQTAQVLRNLCYQIQADKSNSDSWDALKEQISRLFGVVLLPPHYIPERGEITMEYKERSGTVLDLSSSGRGLQQTLLLLAHLYANPRTVLLLDEPDAHLEILRQRQTYNLLTEVADKQGSQIIAASHSEVVLNEAAGKDVVIAFVGKPHQLNNQGAQLKKALTEIGFDHYYQAEQRGWVLYLEGSTDLAILSAFAELVQHPAREALSAPFVHYVGNVAHGVRQHFWGLKEARPDLVGIAIFDRPERSLPDDLGAVGLSWSRREIENYFCMPDVLLQFATQNQPDDLFGRAESERRGEAMREAIAEVSQALRTLRNVEPWSAETKVTDDFLNPLFAKYFEKIGLKDVLRKSDYYTLVRYVPKEKIDKEIIEKLDAIVEVSKKAIVKES